MYPSEVEHLQLELNGINLHLACQGTGPLVVMCHGYPGLWYSWRHQMVALARAGYRSVALDMRGYGRSSRPIDVNAYGFDQLSADVLGVMDYFQEDQAVLLGHDFGANLAWYMGIYHPDRLRGIVPLCVPYDMELAGGCDIPPSELYAAIAGRHFFHMHYYQQPGVAEQHLLGREREFLERLFWALSAQGELLSWENYPSEGTQYLDVLSPPGRPLPWPWLSVEDMDYYVQEYLAAGPQLAFTGGANSYRAMDHNWRLTRDHAHAELTLPALWVGGEQDPVVKLAGDAPFAHMRNKVRDLRGLVLLPDAGHFIQQEQPALLNALLIEFLASL
ncbi:alpha/beta hydrolase [Seongchinamella unica]|uniref:Alpha/beta hydrolase n=1 Tax=Seongchinamella unica TaxID=2547392 RepID=A0A4R5LWK6_9GAMM|nr:alpha/beta hydrolase [Seongchinamella unica]TDG15864.1 alpha/beta hydrolase [Seongchinamella unica]